MPSLLYGCEIFSNSDFICTNKLNKVYNTILRYVYGLRRYESISVYRKRLYGVTLMDLMKCRTLKLLHKIIADGEPAYLAERIEFIRSRRRRHIKQLRHTSLISDRQFFVYAIRLWNALPAQVQRIDVAARFMAEVGRYYS